MSDCIHQSSSHSTGTKKFVPVPSWNHHLPFCLSRNHLPSLCLSLSLSAIQSVSQSVGLSLFVRPSVSSLIDVIPLRPLLTHRWFDAPGAGGVDREKLCDRTNPYCPPISPGCCGRVWSEVWREDPLLEGAATRGIVDGPETLLV